MYLTNPAGSGIFCGYRSPAFSFNNISRYLFMSFTAFVFISASAVLHATWHFMVKQSKPVPALFIPISGANLLFTLAFALSSGCRFSEMPAMLFFWAFCGGTCGVICNLGLTRAYRLGEVSLAYPLARALPVILTMLITSLFGLGKALSFCGAAAMVIIFAGCVIMPLDSFSEIKKEKYLNRTLPGILIAAAGTTGYTIFDNLGLKIFTAANKDIPAWHASMAYSNLRECFLFLVLITAVALLPSERKNFSWSLFKNPLPYFAGVFSGAAYALILISMLFVSNVSYVQAFRQISLPAGVLLGIIFLHEKCNAPKITGLFLIISGLALSVLN